MANHAINIVTFYGRTAAIEAIKKDAQNCRHNQILEGLYPNPSGDNDDEEWCKDNWGTKWGAYNTSIVYEKVHNLFSDIDTHVYEPDGTEDEFQYDAELDVNESVTFQYSTAWSPASDALDYISKKYDVVAIEAFCEPGENFCGYRTHTQGTVEAEMVYKFLEHDGDNVYDIYECKFVDVEEPNADHLIVCDFAKEMFEAVGSFYGGN